MKTLVLLKNNHQDIEVAIQYLANRSSFYEKAANNERGQGEFDAALGVAKAMETSLSVSLISSQ